jgi:hypothetical protein
MRSASLACALVVAGMAGPANARVAEATATGFLVQHEVDVHVMPISAWKALIGVGAWWNPEHTYSGHARNLHIDARPGGCFCERLPSGGGVEHLRVVYVAPGSVLRMSGALGPLQGSGLAGSLTITLQALPGGLTRIALGYSVGGYMQGGVDRIAPAADAMLGEQIERLRRHIDRGRARGTPTG